MSKLLLTRALDSPRISHFLYWNLKLLQTDMKSRTCSSMLLEALQSLVGTIRCMEFANQVQKFIILDIYAALKLLLPRGALNIACRPWCQWSNCLAALAYTGDFVIWIAEFISGFHSRGGKHIHVAANLIQGGGTQIQIQGGLAIPY